MLLFSFSSPRLEPSNTLQCYPQRPQPFLILRQKLQTRGLTCQTFSKFTKLLLTEKNTSQNHILFLDTFSGIRFFCVRNKKTKITPTTSVKIKEKELEQIPNAPRDYVFVSEVDDSKIYVKNTSTNQLIKLELTKDGNMGYFYNDKGELIILIDNKKYRLVR